MASKWEPGSEGMFHITSSGLYDASMVLGIGVSGQVDGTRLWDLAKRSPVWLTMPQADEELAFGNPKYIKEYFQKTTPYSMLCRDDLGHRKYLIHYNSIRNSGVQGINLPPVHLIRGGEGYPADAFIRDASPERVSGNALWDLLKESPEWASSTDLAHRLHLDRDYVRGILLDQFPGLVLEREVIERTGPGENDHKYLFPSQSYYEVMQYLLTRLSPHPGTMTLIPNRCYQASILRESGLDGIVYGDQLWDALLASSAWLPVNEAVDKIGLSETHTRAKVLRLYSDLVAVNGGSCGHLYHRSVIAHLRRDQRQSETGLFVIARKLGISDSYAYSLASRFNLGSSTGENKHRLSPLERRRLREMVRFEKKAMAGLKERIDPSKSYTTNSLERTGLPLSIINQARKAGRFEDSSHILGIEMIAYLDEQYPEGMIFQGFMPFIEGNPDLYSRADISYALRLPRGETEKRIETLVAEDPTSCFRLRKSPEGRQRVFFTQEGYEALAEWDVHQARLPIQVMYGLSLPITPWEPGMPLSVAFEYLSQLRNSQEAIETPRLAQTRETLSHILQYMDRHGYALLEVDRTYSVENVRRLVEDGSLYNSQEHLEDLLAALANDPMGAVHQFSAVLNLSQSLISPIQKFFTNHIMECGDPVGSTITQMMVLGILKRMRDLGARAMSVFRPFEDVEDGHLMKPYLATFFSPMIPQRSTVDQGVLSHYLGICHEPMTIKQMARELEIPERRAYTMLNSAFLRTGVDIRK